MNADRTLITKLVSYAIVGILSMIVFRLLMPQGTQSSFGIWVASLLFGVIMTGILRMSDTLKKK